MQSTMRDRHTTVQGLGDFTDDHRINLEVCVRSSVWSGAYMSGLLAEMD